MYKGDVKHYYYFFRCEIHCSCLLLMLHAYITIIIYYKISEKINILFNYRTKF